ncbi:MAG: DUF790 family protein [Myxococcales bacterium]|nr:DUF790 family protein [Myxococcales bacterium]
MLPADVQSFRVVRGEIVPDWLTPADHPWLRDLLDLAEARVGGTAQELDDALANAEITRAPLRRLRMAKHVLRGLVERRPPERPLEPRAVREVVFGAATDVRSGGSWSREEALRRAGEVLRASVEEVERCLLLDLPGEKRVALSEPLPSPVELAARINLALVQGLLRRARTVRVVAHGNARDLVRHARLQGLLCVARRTGGTTTLEFSGPVALFRHTTLYGRAQASLLPRLPWCDRFELAASCVLGGAQATLRLGPADPAFPSTPPRRFDSALEEAFAKELARRHPDWGLVREPEAVEADGVLLFPDFALFRRDRPRERWMVEIVGFWTPEYLRTKLEHLGRAAGEGWIVCVDERLNCGTEGLPDGVSVVPFKRRLKASGVLEVVSGRAPLASRPPVSLGLTHFFVDWAGRKPPTDPVHARLASLRAGDPVTLVRRGPWVMVEAEDGPVAALSAKGRDHWAPRLGSVREARVAEVRVRQRSESGPAFRGRLRVDAWRVPVVEVDLEPQP